MKKNLLSFLLLFITLNSIAQIDYSSIDENSKTVPDSLKTYSEIAFYLANDLSTETEKARALYIWITHNIQYDMQLFLTEFKYYTTDELITSAIDKRKGVCQHYSELFTAMSNSIGLDTYVIGGYTRDQRDEIADLDHAWNAIKIDTNYYLLDLTWAAGYLQNGKYYHIFRDDYFLINPREFIKDHMPFDPMWQLQLNPISHANFMDNDYSKLDKKGGFMYHDSIQKYQLQNEIIRLEFANKRIFNCGVRNKHIQKAIDNNLMMMDSKKYNLAIDTLNYGIENYNLYIDSKNKQFSDPKLADEQLERLMKNASNGMQAADKLLYGIFSDNQELNTLILEAKKEMPRLLADLKREQEFLERYLEKWGPLRIFMFFN